MYEFHHGIMSKFVISSFWTKTETQKFVRNFFYHYLLKKSKKF